MEDDVGGGVRVGGVGSSLGDVIDVALLDELTEPLTDLLLVVDSNEDIAFVSRSAHALLGYEPAALLGRSVRDFIAPEVPDATVDVIGHRSGLDAATRIQVVDAHGARVEFTILAGDGKRLWGHGFWSMLAHPVTTVGERLDALGQRVAFEDLLTRVASGFVQLSADDIDEGVLRALADIAAYASVDRAYVFLVDDRRRTLELSHEWTAAGVEPRPPPWRSVHQATVPGWMGTLRAGKPIYLPRVADLDPEWVSERALLLDSSVASMLGVPIADQQGLVGMIGFDSVADERSWSDDHLVILESAAGIISQALARRDAAQRATMAFDRAPLGMAVLSVDGRHLEVNDAYVSLFARTADELLAVPLLELVERLDRGALLTCHHTLVQRRQDQATVEVRVPRRDSISAWIRLHLAGVHDGDGALRYLLVHAEDITHRHLQDLELQASEERYRTLVENSPAAVTRFDRHRRLVFASPAVESISGSTPAELVGSDLASLGLPDLVARWGRDLDRVFATGARVDAEWDADIAGERRWFQSRAVPEFDEAGEVEFVLVMSTEITPLKRSEAELAHRAMHDPLTGVANRLLLEQALTGHLVDGSRAPGSLAVLFLDLDRFKLVNDSLGHHAGDELLNVVAARLVALVPASAMVARLGGDEFVVLLTELDAPTAAIDLAALIHQEVSVPVLVASTSVTPTVSIGVAIHGPEHLDAGSLLGDADSAMYLAKARGRHRTELCDDDLRTQAGKRLDLERHLRGSVVDGGLLVHYQPELAIAGERAGQVVGVEALARWLHPERGLLQAGAFIELAEETGLILEVGRWVLTEACRQLGSWLEDDPGLDLAVRVNLSPRQLAQHDLVDVVVDALAAGGVAPQRLCLEITETALMDDPDHGARILADLHDLGVRLAIDDFGTGYSSLAQLKRFPVDVLKIDRSFVDGLGTDPGDTAIVEAIVSMAVALDLQVVAEGVETEVQLAELLRLGCERAQGFLWAHAEPADTVVGHFR